MSSLPIALTVAGSDPSGGAGIQADLKSFHSREVYGMAVITALTAQNTTGVQDIFGIPAHFVDKQMDSIFSDEKPQAMKTGMIASTDVMEVIEKWVKKESIDYVLDPVMVSTSGHTLIPDDAVNFLIEHLIPLSTTLTPNLLEAERISGVKINNADDFKRAAKVIVGELGAHTVIIKGGHFDENGQTVDYFYSKDHQLTLTEQRIKTSSTHGTGCSFAAVITAELAKGKSLVDSFKVAKKFITAAISNHPNIGKGNGPVNHFIYKGE